MRTAPILILFFNRADSLRQVLERAAAADPARVYLACDGPRDGNGEDRSRVAECRRIAEGMPWRCPVSTRFLDRNEGCARGVSGAVSWFFGAEERGIVLEDDCLPHPTFFPFATELLDRYAGDDRVMSISGTCFDGRAQARGIPESYRFSRLPHVWGWASWARAWRLHRLGVSPADIDRIPAANYPVPAGHSRRLWRKKFLRVAGDAPSTWDYQWTLAHFLHGGLTAVPRENLVTNLVTGSGAHINWVSPWQCLPTAAAGFPLVHPAQVRADAAFDAFVDRVHCNHRPWVARKAWQFARRHRLADVARVRAGKLFGSLADG